jgi:hypothetical protein
MTNTETKIKVTYDAVSQELMIYENGKVKGYTGSLAGSKLIDMIADDNVDVTMVDNDTAYRHKLNRTLHYHLNARGVDQGLYLCILKHNYGVESSTELSNELLCELIEDIKCLQTPEDVRKERSGILYLLDKLGIRGNAIDGWQAVNEYLRSPKIAGKPLYEMTYPELQVCRKKLRAIYYKSNKEPLDNVERL